MNIITVIHQPSPSVFLLFDEVRVGTALLFLFDNVHVDKAVVFLYKMVHAEVHVAAHSATCNMPPPSRWCTALFCPAKVEWAACWCISDGTDGAVLLVVVHSLNGIWGGGGGCMSYHVGVSCSLILYDYL